MRKLETYTDALDEFLHPFWLGLIMLFTIITVVGILCCVRRQCGSYLCYLCNYLCCRSELNDENHMKINLPPPNPYQYQWAPAYAPPFNPSPKFYKLVRSIQTMSTDSTSPIQHEEKTEGDTTNNDVLSTIDEIDRPKTSLFDENRTSEAARRFFASMRYTSQGPNSSSIDSANTEPADRPKKGILPTRLKFIRTSPFFQSIINTRD